MDVTRLVVTDGRRDLCDAMLASFDWCCPWPFARTVVVDDSGDPAYGDWLESRVPDAVHVHHPERRGLAAAIASGWGSVGDCEYVVHLEDDLVFSTPIDVAEWVSPLTRSPHLVQVCLQRGPISPEEHEAGGILALYARTGEVRVRATGTVTWTEHSKLFSLQPCAYRAALTGLDWPAHGGEAEFTALLRDRDPGVSFAYLDSPSAAPRYVHEGHWRSPGWML